MILLLLGTMALNLYLCYCMGYIKRSIQVNQSFLRVLHQLEGDITVGESSDITRSLFDIPLDRSSAPMLIKLADKVWAWKNSRKAKETL